MYNNRACPALQHISHHDMPVQSDDLRLLVYLNEKYGLYALYE